MSSINQENAESDQQVMYTLDFPWYGNLPRVEARDYLEQYGGGDDVWIGKTLYR